MGIGENRTAVIQAALESQQLLMRKTKNGRHGSFSTGIGSSIFWPQMRTRARLGGRAAPRPRRIYNGSRWGFGQRLSGATGRTPSGQNTAWPNAPPKFHLRSGWFPPRRSENSSLDSQGPKRMPWVGDRRKLKPELLSLDQNCWVGFGLERILCACCRTWGIEVRTRAFLGEPSECLSSSKTVLPRTSPPWTGFFGRTGQCSFLRWLSSIRQIRPPASEPGLRCAKQPDYETGDGTRREVPVRAGSGGSRLILGVVPLKKFTGWQPVEHRAGEGAG